MSFDTEPMFATGGALRGAVARRLMASDTAPEAAAGTRIGAFEIREPIGRGGMGAVFRAERVEGGFEQTVAIKRMSATDATTRERFRAEMEILARLAHPNIAQLVDGGVCADGSLYLAMEYVDGEPIDDYCERLGLDTPARIRLLLRIADALAHAHRSLVIHRDIKPSNILVRRNDGRPKLLDFGIAKLYGEAQDRELTQQGLGPMTPTYAAPEQFRAQPVTVATDIYQFGVLMYRLLSGGLPYDTPTDDPVAWARAVLEHDPLALDRARLRRSAASSAQTSPVSQRGLRDLDAIVQMALKKDPAERYGAMLALIADLEAFLDGRPVVARHGGTGYRLGRFVARHRWTVLAAAVAVLGLAATSLVALSQARQAREEATKLRASVDLLNAVFAAADVNAGRGGKRSLEDLLDVAAKDVVQRLDRHPELRAGVLLQVADVYASMGLPARAAPLYTRSIADFRSRGEHGMAYTRALERGALAAYWNGDFRQSQAWIDEATALATGSDDASADIRDGLHFTRWQMLRSEGRIDECREVAEFGVRNAAAAGDDIRDDLMQRALVRRGTTATDQRRYDEAERDLKQAVHLAERRFGTTHAATLKAKQALGWHYATRGDLAEGLAILEPVGEQVIEVFGQDSQEWARNQFNRANIYALMPRRWEDAVRAYREAARVYQASTSPHFAVGGLHNAALVLAAHGRCAEALPLFADTERHWRESQGLRNPWFKRVPADRAACELALGNLAAAQEQIARSQSLYDADERRQPNYAHVLAIAADVAEAAGDRAEARRLLGQAIDLVADDPAWAEARSAWQKRLAKT